MTTFSFNLSKITKSTISKIQQPFIISTMYIDWNFIGKHQSVEYWNNLLRNGYWDSFLCEHLYNKILPCWDKFFLLGHTFHGKIFRTKTFPIETNFLLGQLFIVKAFKWNRPLRGKFLESCTLMYKVLIFNLFSLKLCNWNICAFWIYMYI